MDAITALLAGVLATLRRTVAPDVCPGPWPWAVSVLGVGVGLLPAVGALVVALARRRFGSSYGTGASSLLVGAGILFAGALPLLVFTATGRLFAAAAAGGITPGLTHTTLRDLRSTACELAGGQADWLGRGSVADAFVGPDPLRLGLAIFLLALAPLLVTVFVGAQARIALRRGPSWPAKAFWVPTLALALLTAGAPAGTTGHLWLGAVFGAFAGMLIVPFAGVPSRATVRRTRTPAPAGPARADRSPGRAVDRAADGAARRFAAREPQPVVAPLSRPTPAPPRPTLVAPVSAPAPAAAAPRFELIRRLGSGGFGRVWLARDAKLGHVVAVKAAHAPDPETEQRIRREAGALAAVRHPHCVRIYDLVSARSDPGLAELDGMVIVMGYVEGTSLGDLVRTHGVLDDRAAARVWISLAGALDAAHRQGVLHRDVKPANVVVDTSGLAHLIDFGIARRSGDATLTQTGFVLGTPDFLAPEIACGQRATPASDAWQLAATVSYALTGQPPRGGHPDAVSGLRAAAAGAPLTHLPRRTAHLALLQAAMDNDPGRRPPLPVVQRALEDWLRRTGSTPTGRVTTAAPGRP